MGGRIGTITSIRRVEREGVEGGTEGEGRETGCTTGAAAAAARNDRPPGRNEMFFSKKKDNSETLSPRASNESNSSLKQSSPWTGYPNLNAEKI